MTIPGRLLPVIVLLMGLATTSCGTPRERIDASAITAQVEHWVAKGYYPGASLIIADRQGTLCERDFGDVHADTVVFIASAGKWLAAAAIAAVVDEGRLTWDEPVARRLPQFAGDSRGRASLRQLLSHTAGFASYLPAPRRDAFQTLAESITAMETIPPLAVPGARFAYGGLAMQVAGRMAELATDQDWATIFATRIARPLGMTATTFTPVDQGHGHSPMLGGGARSTARDYLRFLEMMAHDGVFRGQRVLSAAAVRELMADQVHTAAVGPDELPEHHHHARHQGVYGLGLWRELVDGRGEAVLVSSPSWAGSYPWLDRTRGVYGIFMAHVEGPAAARDRFDSFHASPHLATLAGQAVDQAARAP